MIAGDKATAVDTRSSKRAPSEHSSDRVVQEEHDQEHRDKQLFVAPHGGLADRLGHGMRSWNPIAAGAAATAIGYAALVLVMVAAGFVLTEWILPGAVTRADGSVNRWLARGRTPLETDLSWIGSHLAESVTVIALGVLVVVICCFRRKFLAAIFLGVAIAVEAATYLATVQVIDRHRPRRASPRRPGLGRELPVGPRRRGRRGVRGDRTARVRVHPQPLGPGDRGVLRHRRPDLRRHRAGVPGHAPPDRRGVRRTDGAGVHRGRVARRPAWSGSCGTAGKRGGSMRRRSQHDLGRSTCPRRQDVRWWAHRAPPRPRS